MVRVLIVGPTSRPREDIEDDVVADLARHARPDVELEYRCTGTGPADIRSHADAEAAAPGVVALVRRAVDEGFDGVVVDCTEDPGVDEADALTHVPVVGPGGALRAAAAAARDPIVWISGDQLRASSLERLVELASTAATVVLGGTGWSHVADVLVDRDPRVVVLDPLPVALERCLALIAG